MARPKTNRFVKNKELLKARMYEVNNDAPKKNTVASLFQDINDLPVWEPTEIGKYKLGTYPYLQTSKFNPDFKNPVDVESQSACWWRRRFGVHWINGVPYVCPKETYNENCPICDAKSKVWDEMREIQKQNPNYGSPTPKTKVYEPYFKKINDEIEAQKWTAMVCDVTDTNKKTERVLFVSKYSKYNKWIDYIMEAMSDEEIKTNDPEEKKYIEETRKQIKKKFNPDNFNGKEIELFYWFDEKLDIVINVKLCGEKKFAYKGLKDWENIDFIEAKNIDESIIDEIPKLDDIFIVKDYKELKEIWEAGEETNQYEEDTPIVDGEPEPYGNEELNKELEKQQTTSKKDDDFDDWGDSNDDSSKEEDKEVEESIKDDWENEDW